VPAGAEDLGLRAHLAIARDDLAGRQRLAEELLVDDADLVLVDHHRRADHEAESKRKGEDHQGAAAGGRQCDDKRGASATIASTVKKRIKAMCVRS